MHFHVSNNFTVHEAPGSDQSWRIYDAGKHPGLSCSDCQACRCSWANRGVAAGINKRTNHDGPPCLTCGSTDKHCECDQGDACNGLKVTFFKPGVDEWYCLSCAVKRGMHIAACRCP